MGEFISVTITGRYRDASARVRARVGSGVLTISKRAYRGACNKCCYAGDDYGVPDWVDGYGPFIMLEDGSLIAFAGEEGC